MTKNTKKHTKKSCRRSLKNAKQSGGAIYQYYDIGSSRDVDARDYQIEAMNEADEFIKTKLENPKGYYYNKNGISFTLYPLSIFGTEGYEHRRKYLMLRDDGSYTFISKMGGHFEKLK
jgi:hypothetical protein